MILNFLAFAIIMLLVIGFAALVVVLGSLPGKIARKRNHQQADAINAASWISLAGFGIFWPLAFVWAFVRPFSLVTAAKTEGPISADEINQIKARLSSLESAMSKS